jgi:hypothetical protein
MAAERKAGRSCREVKQQLVDLFNTPELRVIWTQSL